MNQEYESGRSKIPLYLKIYQEVLAQITGGGYPPGSKLPSEKELAKAYGVSRITSKKAMDTLAANGYISRTPGRGTFVLSQEKEPPKTSSAVLENRLIGVIIERFSSGFGGELVLGIERECAQHGYVMALRCSYHSKDAEEAAIDQLLQLGVAGLIIMCVYDETYNPSILKLSLEDFPVVLVDREMSGIPLPCVSTDNLQAAKQLTDILLDQGHQRVTFVTAANSLDASTVKDRADGFSKSCLEHGIFINRADWITSLYSTVFPTSGKSDSQMVQKNVALLKRYMLDHPQTTAYLAASYEVAYLTILAARECGDGIYRQTACFDAPEGVFREAPLLHIRQGQEEIGRMAVRRLLSRIRGKQVPRMTYVDYQLLK